ncbi:MAG: P-loop NTPase [Coriobacteriia bacterium]|nr:P-loop NTPase [Coriobacteriia bacterium]
MTTIVIASGKGGTGKTTLTSLFAALASEKSRVVVVDADVEASNLPIAMGVVAERCQAFAGQSKISIDPAVCSGCSACELVCRFGALSFDMETGAFVVDPAACERCGFCAYVCPLDAVRTVDSVSGEACVGMSPVGPMAFGKLEPGEDLSGRLVSEVRRLGSAEALDTEATVVLVDGPPGVGCPAMASMAETDLLVAVAEPTVSGQHDLVRIVELAGRFNLPVLVVLNKSDLSPSGAERIRELCHLRELPLIAEIPFDPRIAQVMSGQDNRLPATGLAVAEATRAWRRIESSMRTTSA